MVSNAYLAYKVRPCTLSAILARCFHTCSKWETCATGRGKLRKAPGTFKQEWGVFYNLLTPNTLLNFPGDSSPGIYW